MGTAGLSSTDRVPAPAGLVPAERRIDHNALHSSAFPSRRGSPSERAGYFRYAYAKCSVRITNSGRTRKS
jgi:hypothetical protein